MQEEYAIDSSDIVAEPDAEPAYVPARSATSFRNARLQALVRGAWRPLVVLMCIAAVMVIARPGEWIARVDVIRDWVQANGLAALLIVLAFYALAAVALVPQTALKIAAGGLFGSWLGVLMASIGSTLGAVACFLLARYVAHGSLMRRLKRWPSVARLDRLARERGTLLVIVTRVLPIVPGNFLNYALGLTPVRLSTFAFWSWLCMLPGIVILVVGTEAVLRGLSEGRVPWELVAIVAGMLALLGAAVMVLRRRLRQEEAGLARMTDF